MPESIEYKFISSASDSPDMFSVIDFKGVEGLSRNYLYTINLKSLDLDIELDSILNNSCSFTRSVGGFETVTNGIISDFEELNQIEDFALYKVVLVPTLWKLSLYHTNEVYLDMSVPEIIETILKETGFHPSIDYELNLNSNYEKWAYRCQYGETYLSFIRRLIEHVGIYYYFEQSKDGEKVIFCDNMQNHVKSDNSDLIYSPVSGLDITEGYNNIHSYICKNKRMPEKVVLKDYNYEKPSLDVEGEAVVDKNGTGEVFIYGENFNTPEEGAKLAKVRSEEILCKKEIFYGEGVVNQITSGYLFNLDRHFREKFNIDFLVTEIEHVGAAPSYLTDSSDVNDTQAYMNTFTAIPAEVQFRPERETEKPKFFGTVNAIIDAEGEGKYAEVDDQGRYKVILPFDRVKRGESGKASCWIRMAQPYSGTTEGMHFPLRKGTEVLLTFINGDPDQPVISGAVPNAAQPSVINSDNQTNNMIKSAAGNLIEMEDKENNNRIKLSTPQNSTYFHLGAPNASGSGIVSLTDGIERKVIGGGQQITVFSSITDAGQMTDQSGVDNTSYGTPGDNAKNFMYSGNSTSADKPTGASGHQFKKKDVNGKNSGTTYLDPLSSAANGELSGEFVVKRRNGDLYSWTNGNSYIFNVKYDSSNDNRSTNKTFTYGNTWSEHHSSETIAAEQFDVLADGRTIKATADKKPAAYGQFMKANDTTNKDWAADLESLKVEKDFCDSYHYTKGDSLEITDGNTHKIRVDHGNDVEISYDPGGQIRHFKDADKEEKWNSTGVKVFYEDDDKKEEWDDTGTMTGKVEGDTEYTYANGFMISKSWDNGEGKTEETVWDRNLHTLASFEAKTETGAAEEVFSSSYAHKNAAEFSFGDEQSFSLSTNASATMSISAGATAEMTISAAASIALEISASASIEMAIKGSVALSMELSASVAINFSYALLAVEVDNDEYSVTVKDAVKASNKAVPVKVSREEAVKIDSGTLDIENATLKVSL
ncbi:MAG: type VI secretion system tip protein VgrG [Deltaproteobacteria bacterium]|nr:type VI secretion system tip protein VgrG [Deltaproteobacteria bacterium]